MKFVRVILTPEAANSYYKLMSKASGSKQEEVIFNAFLQKVELLKEDNEIKNLDIKSKLNLQALSSFLHFS